jgi:diacylglycerol O-acyltransferase / wax synthase
LGGTVNDAYVTGVSGAAGAYHRAHGVDVDDLRMSMPVNLRDDNSAGGNAFSPARVLVPAGIEDPVERFKEVHTRLATTKSERALGLTGSFAGVLNQLPTALVVRLARQQVETVDFATSNLRGANFDLYVAGAHVLANHPMGPTGGTAFNATVLGYKDSLDLGLNIDTAAVDDPEVLRTCIEEAFAELAKLGR